MQFLRELFAIRGRLPRLAKGHFQNEPSLVEQVPKVRGKGHVPPIRDLGRDIATTRKHVAQSTRSDRTAKLHHRFEQRAPKWEDIRAIRARSLWKQHERNARIQMPANLSRDIADGATAL